jgi:LacI family transcriptional regulator
MATIKDLAAMTGYAVGTVSRVLNHHPNVSDKARNAILQAVEESGFQLNQNAKQLKQTRSTSILVLVKGTANEMFAQMVETIQSAIAQTSYSLHVDYLDENENEVLRAIQLCREKKPLGIFFLGGSSQAFTADFSKIDIPCVLVTVDGSGLNFSNLSSVYTDDEQAARQASEHLIGLGHRRIAMIGGPRELSDISRLRYQGCIASFRAHGIAFDEALDYRNVRFSFEGGYQGAKSLLDAGRQFTAIFAASDMMAIGAIRALNDAGLRVPEDISVMGFDGVMLGSYLTPRLSTIAQSVDRMARRAVEILLDCVEQNGPPRHETVPFTLCDRESTRRLNGE